MNTPGNASSREQSRSRTNDHRPPRLRPVTLALFAGVLGASLGAASLGHAQIGVLSGKNSAFLRDSYSGILPGTSPGTQVAALTIAKGKKKRALVVDVTTTHFNVAEKIQPVFIVEVNGQILPPGREVDLCDIPTNGTVCTGTISWWMDIAELEATAPGTILNKPLDVRLFVSDTQGSTTLSSFALQYSARLEKH